MVDYGYPYWSCQRCFGLGRRDVYAYNSFKEMTESKVILPDGSVQLTPRDPRYGIGYQEAIVRPVVNSDGSSDFKISTSGSGVSSMGIMSITSKTVRTLNVTELKALQGKVISTSNGVPIKLGAPIYKSELKGYKPTTVKMSGNVSVSTPDGKIAMTGEPISTTAIIVLIIIITVSIAVMISAWAWQSTEKDRLAAEVQKSALEAASAATEIQSDTTDALGNRFIVYRNGTVVKIDKDGNMTVDTTGTSNIGDIASDVANNPAGTAFPWETIQWGVTALVVGGIVLGGLYIFFKHGVPAMQKKTPQIVAAPASTSPIDKK